MIESGTGSLLYDRLFSVSMTTTNLRRSCLSRGTYEGVATDLDGNGGLPEPFVEEKAVSSKSPPSHTGSIERADSMA